MIEFIKNQFIHLLQLNCICNPNKNANEKKKIITIRKAILDLNIFLLNQFLYSITKSSYLLFEYNIFLFLIHTIVVIDIENEIFLFMFNIHFIIYHVYLIVLYKFRPPSDNTSRRFFFYFFIFGISEYHLSYRVFFCDAKYV